MKAVAWPAWLALGVTVVAMAAVMQWVDLSPRVETDFFFSPDDPQPQATAEIARRFPTGSQVLMRISGQDLGSPSYRNLVRQVTTSAREIEQVTNVTSIVTVDVTGPLWGRLLINPDRTASYLLLDVQGGDDTQLVHDVEAVADQFSTPETDIEISGVPYVLELIRQNLFRDLMVFSAAALVVFGVASAVVYRRLWIVIGTLASCLIASGGALLIVQLFDIAIGLLTANLATIVFVLTLSHIVFLTSNWRRGVRAHAAQSTTSDAAQVSTQGQAPTPASAVRTAVRETFPASFWCMATTLLGFLSLLFATAKPLRELGMAGAVGAVVAILTAYLMYPAFLSAAATRTSPPRATGELPPWPSKRSWWTLTGVTVAGLTIGTGIWRVSTDPGLLSYFAEGSDLRNGLEAIDRDGGSSPLSVVIHARAEERVDGEAEMQAMQRLHDALESHPAVGTVLSPPLFIAEARRVPFMGALTARQLLSVPVVGRLASSFISEDRRDGHFWLRMRESGREVSRSAVLEDIRRRVADHGFEITLMGGLYELQWQLGRLLASSLRIGLTGLLLLFGLLAYVLSRSVRTALAMLTGLIMIPLVVLGSFGHAGVSVDIISSPAANLAMAMGVDSMIHLVVRARRLAGQGWSQADRWRMARSDLWHPIVGASVIICAGFGIFGLSTFPPTRRFGLAVILGTVTAATMALGALPLIASGVRRATRAGLRAEAERSSSALRDRVDGGA